MTSDPFEKYVAVPGLAPVYTWGGWTTMGTITVMTVVTEDMNADGRDDLVAHFYQMLSQGAGWGQVVTSNPPNRLVAWLSQADGTFLEATSQLFGSDIVVLPGTSRKVDVGDLNHDGRRDWVYAVNREDGRSAADLDHLESQASLVLSQPDGTYDVVNFGEADWYHAARIYQSGGIGHVLAQGFSAPHLPIGSYQSVFVSTTHDYVLNPAGTGLVSVGTLPADPSTFVILPAATPGAEVTHIVSPVRQVNNLQSAGLLVVGADGQWQIADSHQPYAMETVNWVAWNGDRGTSTLTMIDGYAVANVHYNESAIIHPTPGSQPVALLNLSGFANTAPRSDGFYYENDGRHFNKIAFYSVDENQLATAPLTIIGEKNLSLYFHLEVLDLDRNGLEDIVAYPYELTARPTVYLNLGNGEFKFLDTTGFPSGPAGNWGPAGSSKFMDANGDGVYDLLYFLTGALPQFQIPEPWQLHLGTTSRLRDFDASPIVIADRAHGILIATWAGDDLITDTNASVLPTTLDGGLGRDTARYAGAGNAYAVTRTGDGGWMVEGDVVTDLLVDIERLEFQDYKVALDIDHAGQAAKVLGVLFGAAVASNKTYAGICLSALDQGMAYETLIGLALEVALGANPSAEQVVDLLYFNLAGVLPSPDEQAYYAGFITGGALSNTSLAMIAADSAYNLSNIGFANLEAHGLAYW